jgi:hypothetical protein
MGREGRALIIGVDPGDTTGLARWDGEMFFRAQVNVCSEHILTYVRHIIKPGDLVVCERFVIGTGTARKHRAVRATEVIGALREYTLEHNARFVLQSAADAKRFASNKLLRRIGWYTPGLTHANDAARHVLLAVARERPAEFDKIVSG